VEGEGVVRLEKLCHLAPPEEGDLGTLYPHIDALVEELSWCWCCLEPVLPMHRTVEEVRGGWRRGAEQCADATALRSQLLGTIARRSTVTALPRAALH
jgi:hypothetical protein